VRQPCITHYGSRLAAGLETEAPVLADHLLGLGHLDFRGAVDQRRVAELYILRSPRSEMRSTRHSVSERYKDTVAVALLQLLVPGVGGPRGDHTPSTGSSPTRGVLHKGQRPDRGSRAGLTVRALHVMPVATPRRDHAPRTPQVQPYAVDKYEAPWREAEDQTSHQSARDVFQHRTIYVDARTECRCVTTHTVSPNRDVATA